MVISPNFLFPGVIIIIVFDRLKTGQTLYLKQFSRGGVGSLFDLLRFSLICESPQFKVKPLWLTKLHWD